MSVKNLSETVLIREATLLPVTLALGEPFLPGWRVLHDIDKYAPKAHHPVQGSSLKISFDGDRK